MTIYYYYLSDKLKMIFADGQISFRTFKMAMFDSEFNVDVHF